MKKSQKKRRRWLWVLVPLLILGGLYAANSRFGWIALPWQVASDPLDSAGAIEGAPLFELSPVQRAADFIPDLTVSGKLEFSTVQEIKAPFDETVTAVFVENGATVQMGEGLLALAVDTVGDELNSAWLELTKQRQALADLVKAGGTTAVMEANAALLTAQEELAKLEDGPTAADVGSAQLAISEAQLAYDELLKRNDPNSSTVRQARFALKQAENEVQRAQTAYNAVAWRGDVAASAEAAALQSATIALENAQSTYDDAVKPPTDLELQKAQLAIAQAQNSYNKLFEQATPAQIEQARVAVAKAEDQVAEAGKGPSSLAIQEAEAQVVTALRRVESVRTKLRNASSLQAPLTGQIVKRNVQVGDVVKEGDVLAVIVDPTAFKLTLGVSELFILRIQPEMAVQIVLDVLPDQPLAGAVTRIAPPEVQTDSSQNSNSSGGGGQLTSYNVTVAVTDSGDIAQLRAGMSAQVTFVGSNQLPPDSWLVPTNGLEMQGEGVGVVQLMRGESPTPLTVEVTDQTQGEWTVVRSTDLQDGDMVVGSTATFLDSGFPGAFGP